MTDPKMTWQEKLTKNVERKLIDTVHRYCSFLVAQSTCQILYNAYSTRVFTLLNVSIFRNVNQTLKLSCLGLYPIKLHNTAHNTVEGNNQHSLQN